MVYRVIDDGDFAVLAPAEHRGFLGPEPTDEQIESERELLAERRVIGVFDETAPQPLPVGTVMSWGTPLTIPSGEIPMWAISGVTVAATHRRRGIARAMLEGELRAAQNAGFAIAGLTVSETTIYGRYGFEPAVPVQRLTIDVRRAGWAGGNPAAQIRFVDREQLADDLEALHERTRTSRLGDIPAWRRRWKQTMGLTPDAEKPRDIRGVRATDGEGNLVGAMSFTLGDGPDFQNHVLNVRHLVAATDDAYAALWRFALTYDLVGTVKAELRPVDEPLDWLVSDSRGIEHRVHDHGWLRILNVPEALAARPLSGPVGVRLRVTDPLGLADGAWTLLQIGGQGLQVKPLEDSERAEVTIDIGALSAAYLGAVTLEKLAAVGRVQGDPAKIRELSVALRTDSAPHLSIWY
nr:GNAT family N-acetyltransferase [Microbacterium amylolyticum]